MGSKVSQHLILRLRSLGISFQFSQLLLRSVSVTHTRSSGRHVGFVQVQPCAKRCTLNLITEHKNLPDDRSLGLTLVVTYRLCTQSNIRVRRIRAIKTSNPASNPRCAVSSRETQNKQHG